MVNDSAGTDVILVDKSQRPASAAGFRAAVAIEAERGLCNKPVLITGTDDFVRVFGSPDYNKYGQANLEAYFLAQHNVPLVVTRARNPELESTAKAFGCMKVTIDKASGSARSLYINSDAGMANIVTPPDADTSLIYFKGEGQYPCKIIGDSGSNRSNIVLRFSKPETESAYATASRVFKLQVFDFAGQHHIDSDVNGELGITPNLEPVLGGGASGNEDRLTLPGYLLDFDPEVTGKQSTVTVYVNGRKGTFDYDGGSVYEAIRQAILKVTDADGTPLFTEETFVSRGDGTFIVTAGKFNCFDLSVSISISASAYGQPENSAKVQGNYYTYGCGSITVTPKDEGATVDFALSTTLYLENRNDYMYMGDRENNVWAEVYSPYIRETFIASFSHDDYDPSYTSMQIDTVLASSKYLVAKTNESFGDYAIEFAEDLPDDSEKEPSGLVKDLQYFSAKEQTPGDGGIVDNAIAPAQRSYAYATALRQIMGNNLTIWRCVVTPNLGDVMSTPDFTGVIEAAAESTLGLSNIGKAASLDVMSNLGGRHKNRFITDFSQYGYRNVGGRGMWLTMAALVTLTLNNNYKAGNEARPPMGWSYGVIECDSLSENFSGPTRKLLAETYKINPAIDEDGICLWRETTSQQKNSALSDTHVIISYCWMKYMIYESMRPFVAEYNDPSTVNEGLRVLTGLNRTFKSRKYILEGKPNADKNVIGDTVMRFDFPVRFMGVAFYVDVYVTAYPQTQSLEISLSEEA